MSDLVVLGFDHTNDATLALEECRKLQKEYLLDLEDAVVVVRDAEGKVHLHQSINLEKAGASWGLFPAGSGACWWGFCA